MNIYIIYSIKLICATFAGGLIGLERGTKKKFIGIKTYAIVCLGSCLISSICMIMTKDMEVTTFGRVVGSILMSLAFLGAGVILNKNSRIEGLTTAASLWFSSCVGIILGSEYFLLAIPALICYFVIIILFVRIEEKFDNSDK